MGGKRNFNGCWTCRLRKVKCDTGKPGCQRCIRAGLVCEGYDIKLSFYQALTLRQDGLLVDIAEKKEGEDKYNRRNMKLGKFPRRMLYGTYKELNQIIKRVDRHVEIGKYNTRVGPFSVYEIRRKGSKNNLNAELNYLLNPGGEGLGVGMTLAPEYSLKEVEDESMEEDQNLDSEMDLDMDMILPLDTNKGFSKSKRLHISGNDRSAYSKGRVEPREELIHQDLIKLAKLSIYGIKGPEYEINDQNIYHISYPTFFPNIDSDEWKPRENYLQKLLVKTPEGKLITTLYMDLVDSFDRLRFGMVKVPHDHNCWDKLVRPYMKRILFEHVMSKTLMEDDLQTKHDELENNAPLLIQNLKLILFLLVVSISSFNMSANKFSINGNEDIDEYLKASIVLRKIGLNLLNYHLDEYDNHVDLKCQEYNFLFLLNIILQIEIDNYFNIFENFELLFSIGEMLMNQEYDVQAVGLEGQVAMVLRNLFRIMYTFFLSTQRINVYNYTLSEEDKKKYKDLNDNYDLSKLGYNQSEEEEEEEIEGEGEGKGEEEESWKAKEKTRKNEVSSLQGLDEEADIIQGLNEHATEEDYETDNDFKQPTIVETTRKLIDETDYNDYTEDIGFKPELDQLSDNSVHLIYGIPRSLMKLFYDIVNLTNHKRVFYNEKRYPRNFPKICSEYEDKLEKWTNKWELRTPVQEGGRYKSQWHESLDYNIRIFHQSLKIYYKRLIKNEIHQHLIESVMKEIKQVQRINPRILINFWTVLICGSDNVNSSLQSDFEGLSQTNPNLTYWRSKQIMIEVNKRRENQDPISWMEMIREWDILLYLG